MLDEAGVTLVNESHGVRSVDVSTNDDVKVNSSPRRITRVTTESGLTIEAKVWVDGSYEGEVIVATPGLRWAKGRESRSEYNESLAGVLRDSDDTRLATPFRVFPTNPGIDATVANHNETHTRLLPNVYPQPPPEAEGQSDNAVMAFEFRPCVTDVEDNRVEIDAPVWYNASHFELVRRAFASGHVSEGFGGVAFQSGKIMPSIAGPISFELPRGGWEYPGANATTRNHVWDNYYSWWVGLFHFMRTDPSVPQSTRDKVASYGLCKDEYVNANPPHWPPQLYVRESVRLQGDVVLTQEDVVGTTHTASRATTIGLGSWFVDLHTAEMVAVKTNASATTTLPLEQPTLIVQNIGAVGEVGQRQFYVFEIPFEVLLPRRVDAANLIVPVCISASRVAFSVYRLETQFMIAGHAAGVAAAMAVASGTAVHDLDVAALQNVLVKQGQVLRRNHTQA
jgi:hypothetical protein